MKLTAVCCTLAILFSLSCNTSNHNLPESGYIKFQDARIYYESHGKGEPILLLHAGFLNTDMWKHQVPELSNHYRVITIDLPGHGRTENDTVRLPPAQVLHALMDSLQLKQASLVGVSMGAASVTDFVISHPERVKKVVLVASGVNGWEKYFKLDTLITQYLDSLFGALDKRDTARAAEVFTRVWFDGPYRSPEQVNDTVRRYIYEATLGNMKKHKVRGWPILSDPPAIETIGTIKNPLLIIDGDQDMPYIGQACNYIHQKVAGSKRLTIPGTGHMLNMEAPAEFNKAVLDFLKE